MHCWEFGHNVRITLNHMLSNPGMLVVNKGLVTFHWPPKKSEREKDERTSLNRNMFSVLKTLTQASPFKSLSPKGPSHFCRSNQFLLPWALRMFWCSFVFSPHSPHIVLVWWCMFRLTRGWTIHLSQLEAMHIVVISFAAQEDQKVVWHWGNYRAVWKTTRCCQSMCAETEGLKKTFIFLYILKSSVW